jgi:hypothetical protein
METGRLTDTSYAIAGKFNVRSSYSINSIFAGPVLSLRPPRALISLATVSRAETRERRAGCEGASFWLTMPTFTTPESARAARTDMQQLRWRRSISETHAFSCVLPNVVPDAAPTLGKIRRRFVRSPCRAARILARLNCRFWLRLGGVPAQACRSLARCRRLRALARNDGS